MDKSPACFSHLPLELREIIWQFTFPPPRIFQVRRFSERTRPTADNSEPEKTGNFSFHRGNRGRPPPVATHVCRESRAVALHRGFFLSSEYGDDDKRNLDAVRSGRPGRPGFWFNPDADVPYLDRNQRSWLYRDIPAVPGWDRVLHVGLEWRAFFGDVPRILQSAQGGEDGDDRFTIASSYWKSAIEPLLVHMPSLQTLNFILPKTRHKGGVAWGREPYEAPDLPAELVPLPETTQVPWITLGAGRLHDTFVDGLTGRTLPLVPWREIREEMETGFKVAFEEEGGDSGAMKKWKKLREDRFLPHRYVRGTPDLVGWWLLRIGAPEEYDNPSIRTFET